MAGSYMHLAGPDGGMSLLDRNMGDAADAIEQLLWLVFRLDGDGEAERLIDEEFYPMVRGENPPDARFERVREIMDR